MFHADSPDTGRRAEVHRRAAATLPTLLTSRVMEPASPLALEQIDIVVRDLQRSLAVSTMHPAFSNWNRAVALPAWRTLKAIADAGQRQRVFSTTEPSGASHQT
jgi:hypothetical protein